MTDRRITTILATAAAALVALLFLTQTPPPDARSGEAGEPFFAQFTDTQQAAALELVEFDSELAVPRAFKLERRNDRWVIRSHGSYPADQPNRLSAVLAAVLTFRREELASELAADLERFDVLDPLDDTLPTAGHRGTRIIVTGPQGAPLADAIIGRAVDERPGFRYLRRPDERRIYVANVGDLPVSTRFVDWVNPSLFRLQRGDIDQVAVRPYSVDPATSQQRHQAPSLLRKTGTDEWTLDGSPVARLNTFNVNLLVTRLVDLKLIDVEPKPESITQSLLAEGSARFTSAEIADLAARGFYLTAGGLLLSREGEVLVHTSSGLFYVVRFGDTAGAGRRYVLISPGLDARAPGASGAEAKERLTLANQRLAPWYFVVDEDSVNRIRLTRGEILAAAAPPAASPRP